MKRTLVKEMRQMPEVTPRTFTALIDRIAGTVQDIWDVDAREVARAAQELKENGAAVMSEIKKAALKKSARVREAMRRTE
jgi:hypothetical protein